MKLLAFETAFEACSIALSIDGEISARIEPEPRRHAELLLPWTEALLAEAGISLSALDAIGFSRGPGSFTSIRIGIGVVQGLAWGADVGVVPVSSLQATAQAVATQDVLQAWVAMDARMNEVYTGRFERADGLMRAVSEERVCAPEQAAEGPLDGWHGVGNGFVRFDALAAYSDVLTTVHGEVVPTAAAVAQLAEAWLRDHEALPAEQAQPVYLRDKVALKISERPA